MKHLDELIVYYIETVYSEGRKQALYKATEVCNKFGLSSYQDKILDLIAVNEYHSTDSLQDQVQFIVYREVEKILNEHSITIDNESNPTLEEVTALADCLYLFQSLEDYSVLENRIYAQDTPINILRDLFEFYTYIPEHRLHELLKNVHENLLFAIHMYIEDKVDLSDASDLCIEHRNTIDDFFIFTQETASLGRVLFSQGYVNLDVEDILAITKIDVYKYIESNIEVKTPQAVLDILSILIIGKDSYKKPLEYFKENSLLFLTKKDKYIALSRVLTTMYEDFLQFRSQKAKGFVEVTPHAQYEQT